MLKKMLKKIGVVCAAIIGLASQASAAITLPTALAVSDVEEMAGLALTGLAVIWAIRKLIKLTNRS